MLLIIKNFFSKVYPLTVLFLFVVTTVRSEDKLSREELNKYIYEYIMDNPEVIIESVDKLRQKMAESAAVDDKFLDENFEQIANNSNIPFADSSKCPPKPSVLAVS